MNDYIVTYFFVEPEDWKSKYGNIKVSQKSKNEIYYRCILNFFESSITNNPHKKHMLICNNLDDISTNNNNIKSYLENKGVILIQQESIFVKRQEKWAGAMYLFDAIKYFVDNKLNFSKVIFFDNDIIINSNLDSTFNLLNEYQWLAYDASTEYKNSWNGVDPKDIYFTPLGGEFLALTTETVNAFLESFLEIYEDKNLNFKTEEHYMSYILFHLERNRNYKGKYVNEVCRRIWTALRHNTVLTNDYKLQIMHLPAEKQYGLLWLSNEIIKGKELSKINYLNILGIKKRPIRYKIKIIIKKIALKYLNSNS